MELKLNIYENKKIVKTYTARDFDLMTGSCEDILNSVNIDKFEHGLESEEAIMEILKLVLTSFSKFKPMLQGIFEGLTDDEYRNTSVKEVANVILNVVKYTFLELFTLSDSKN